MRFYDAPVLEVVSIPAQERLNFVRDRMAKIGACRYESRVMKWFTEGRDLRVESPEEGFYIRTFLDGEREIRLWEVHAGTKIGVRQETETWVGTMTAGELEFWVEEVKKNLFPSDIVVLPAQTPYRFRALGEKSARMVWFRPIPSKR